MRGRFFRFMKTDGWQGKSNFNRECCRTRVKKGMGFGYENKAGNS